MFSRFNWVTLLSVVCMPLLFRPAQAQLGPAEVGTTVNGYQDDFDVGTLNPNWIVRGQNVFSVRDGVLQVASAGGDPNHLLYESAGYNPSVQEVLARIRVMSFGSGDPARAGLATAVDPGTSQGINLHFRDEPSPGQRHIEFLDDARAWGPELTFNWQTNTWYWLRLRHEPNAASQGGINDVFGKTWLGDGSEAEPAGWQMSWNYTPAQTARSGFAGLTAGSLGGTAEFEVDYCLIKASGLPDIVVAPNALVQTPVSITNQPQSQTVIEGSSATFTVGAQGNPRPTFQWYRSSLAISAATNSSYTLDPVRLTDHGAVLRVIAQNVISNTPYTATSSPATLNVTADTTPPRLSVVQALGLTQVQIVFSERITLFTATNRNHYRITNASGSLAVANVTLDASQSNVVLNVSAMTQDATYTLVVNNVRDTSDAGNLIAANTTTNFTATSYTAVAIGNPQPPGSAVPVPGGLNVTAGGRDLGGTSDQFQFHYQVRTGDFDVKLRIDSLSLADAWAEAGVLAREDLNGGGRFASAMATPSISGAYFQYRNATNSAATLLGSFPVNYPNTWLRLRRVGSQFTGYAGFDGANWTMLGSASISMPATVFLGLAAASHNTNQTTTVAFRDFANVSGGAGVNGPWPVEPLGQSSRRTGLVISEIMYHPIDRADGRNLEFIELFNSLGTPEDLSGWRLDGDADFRFPTNTLIPGGGFLVVAQVPADVEAVYGISGVLGPFSNTNSLPNTRGTVQLRNRPGAVFLEARYDTEAPWPIAADGAGHSLVLARPSYGEGNVEAWAASDAAGGSPGRLDPVTMDPRRHVVINEFLAHTDDPEVDFIELYNRGNQPADISGCYLSDARDTNKFTIPAFTVLPPRGFIAFNQNQFGFALSSGGERIYFRDGSNSRVIDAIRFEAQANGVSSGRSPDGAPSFSELTTKTPGTNNGARLIRDVVINEIMYHPISGDSDDEFVELYNRGSSPVALAGWRLTGGISFTFAANTVLPANGYLVIARNVARLLPRYPNLNAGNTVGDFGGALANDGERLALTRPDPRLTTNNNVITTNFDYVVVDEVTYRDGGRWGQWSDGGGSSLELIDARSDNRLAANWADSDETSKAPWTTVSVSGVIDNGTSAADQLQVLLQGRGECLIDDVEVRTSAGVNLIANSTFESNATGWTAEGTEEPSGWETSEGYQSARSYHVRATDRGDNQVNRIRTPLTAAQTAGVTNTIRAKVRWLRGHPEILFRLRGNWLEAAATMDLPTNPGTPGAGNSRALANAGPAIYDVTHHPPVPAANEAVLVTARVHDPDGMASVQLRYRLDPGATLTTVAMLDNGTSGDAVAGDGLYSATIPGQAANTLVAFRVQATDGFIPAATTTFPAHAPTGECLVRFGESVPTGNFPSYRFWMTQATFNTWDARNNLNNTLNDVTFVLGNHRVIYNAGAVYAGSPYIAPGFNTPTGNRCGYTVEFPADDRFLGDTALVLDWPGGHGNENTAIQEQMAYWIADQIDLAFSHRYHIRLTVNGVTDLQRGGVFEAVIQPAGDFLAQWSPGNSEGHFFKIDRAFEFNDSGGRIADPEPQLRVYTTPDVVFGGLKKKTEKYRWYWLKRSFDSANDYTNLFVLADALNATGPEPYTTQTEALADVEQWMRIFAVEHIINNFDSWGHDIGKNMYMFLPKEGRAQLYLFDLDWLMLVSPNGPGGYTATTGPLFSCDDPTVVRMYNHPPWRRAYFRAVEDAVNQAFLAAKYEAVMDAKYNSLVANGISLCDGQALTAPTALKTWFSQRRGYLVTQLASVAAPFTVTGTNYFAVTSNLVTLSGRAPITVETIQVNGLTQRVTWTGVNNWTLRLPLAQATNVLTILGHDLRGRLVAGASNQVTVVYSGPVPEAAGAVVINEIMYAPTVPDAEFVELFNTSPDFAFDLTGWRFNGLDYRFPEGSFIAPRGFLVLTKDHVAAALAYGPSFAAFDAFNGNLQRDGESLTVFKPLGTNGAEGVIDRVRYENTVPWPTNASGLGPSLQLIDAWQDNARVSNWAESSSGWRFFTFTGVASGNRFLFYLDTAGTVFLDDLEWVAGSLPGVGSNLFRNGDFETPLAGTWSFNGTIMTNSIASTEQAHTGQSSLKLVFTAAGGTASYVFQDITNIIVGNTYTFSCWYLPTTNANNLRTRVSTFFQPSVNLRPILSTPGASNAVAASLPSYPLLWINELQAENVSGITDNHGQRDPWVELYNASTQAISLDGIYLANNYTNLAQWSFATGTVVTPGEFKVIFADAEPAQSTASEPHTSFRLSAGSGSLALSRLHNGVPQVMDYLNYRALDAGRSYGSYPDGQPFERQEFYRVTAGGTNDGTSPPVVVLINEWMASNVRALRDPADGDFNDWFELYNPATNAVDLSGYYLTDNLTNRFQYRIPSGYAVPPRDYLLVWADGETGQNSSNQVDLHANFQLSRNGEAIGLFAPDGQPVDTVTFGPQSDDVSQGRCPDGGSVIVSMTNYSPRLPNVCAIGNAAPVLAGIGHQVVHRGEVLRFTASASDSDPGQTLSFSLDPGSPPGAAIIASTGAFTWPTMDVLAPRTNAVTVRVTDNGSPALDDFETITIVVLAAPGFSTLGRAGDQLSLGWATIAGRTYRVEYADSLVVADWQPLGSDLLATGDRLSIEVSLTSPGQRFFRILLVP